MDTEKTEKYVVEVYVRDPDLKEPMVVYEDVFAHHVAWNSWLVLYMADGVEERINMADICRYRVTKV